MNVSSMGNPATKRKIQLVIFQFVFSKLELEAWRPGHAALEVWQNMNNDNYTITIHSLALGVKKGPMERGHGDLGRREDIRDKQGCR